MPADSETTETVTTLPSVIMQVRSPSTFNGDSGQDPGKWLKEYDRVAKFNRWDDMVCLANVYFFLNGTARQWYENNEDLLNSWTNFKTELQKAFGDDQQHIRKAEDLLKFRAQERGESIQCYIQDVLRLCNKINPQMKEEDKVAHLMKGVAEDVYQALLTKEIATTTDFIKWCQFIENMQQKRIGRKRFDRLPNVVPVATLEDQTDMCALIRQIVKEEIQRILSPQLEEEIQISSLDSIVRDEVKRTLAPISRVPAGQEVRPTSRNSYATAARQPPKVELPTRKTDLWRTEDNRPVCFHCGRPGHVVRYCRERRQVFEAYRSRREPPTQTSDNDSNDDIRRPPVRSRSPYFEETRGRSPTRRRLRSLSPYRRSSRSPSRRSEEN